MRSVEAGNANPGSGDIINLYSWWLEDEEDLLLLARSLFTRYGRHRHIGRGTSVKNELRCEAGAKMFLGGESSSRDGFEDRALPGGLITVEDTLG